LGETIIIDTEKKTAVDETGANVYDRLDTAPKLFAFQPGSTTIDVTGSNTTANTSVRCEYALRFEVVH
jgi:phage-related protein